MEPPRRFYAEVDVESLAGGHFVRLDGRGARTPLGKPLAAPTRRLAELIATEWAAQDEHIDFSAMPATRLLHTALDGISETRVQTEKSVVDYLGSDLICYLAEGPGTLVERQRSVWNPLLAWADEALGLTLVQTAGIVHRAQPRETLERAAEIAAAMNDFVLAGVAFGSALFGSTVLSLALSRGRLDGAQAHAAARIEEAFQEERWGVDAEAAVRTAGLLRDALMLEQWRSALIEV